MSSAEQMQVWRDAIQASAGAVQSCGTSFTSTGTGTFNQPDPFLFGYCFVRCPVVAYSVDLSNYDPTDATAVLSQGYTFDWVIDDQGLYIGAYIGARVTACATGALATHRFDFREVAVKNAIY